MANQKKKRRIGLIIFIIILLIIAIAGISAGAFVAGKLGNLNVQEIDISDLAVNEELYSEVSDTLSKSEFNDVITVALFGTDSRDTSDMSAGRSDTIIIASINPKFKTIKLISIPRDTYVSVPGYGNTKINHAYAYGGEALTIKTINENFGLDITEYATIDFSGLIHIINDIGGIEMNITKSEMDYINERVSDSYKVTGNSIKKLTSYGNITLTGEQALTHSRNRTLGNDFTRAGRQRQVLEAIMNKMAKMGSSKILEMSDSILKEVKTNINVMDYVGQLTGVLMNYSEYFNNITSIQIPSTEYGKGDDSSGTYYFKADAETMRKDMIDNIYRK